VPAGAAVYTAKNFTNWAGSSTNHTHVVTGRVGNGTWQLGRNFYTVYVTVGAPVNGNSGVPLTGTYLNLANAANNTAAHTLGPATINNGPLSSTTVGADSKITVTHAATPPNGIYNINMNLHAYSNHNLFRAVGVAKARGTDPLEIVTPGVFAQTLSLGPDSSVWVSPDSVGDESRGYYELRAPGVSGPLARVEVWADHDGIDADVLFGSSSDGAGGERLKFYRAGYAPGQTPSPVPVTPDAVEDILRTSAQLNSESGVSSPLDLFTWVYDMSGMTLPTGASFDLDSESTVTFVPEPASLGTVLATGVLLLRRRPRAGGRG
jgi:hypothetical protein